MSNPFGLGGIFVSLFLLIWTSVFTFGISTIVWSSPALIGVILYVVPITIIYYYIKIVFMRYILTIKSLNVKVEQLPFKKEIIFNNVDDLEFREIKGRHGDIIKFNIKQNKVKIGGIPTNELGVIFFKFLEIYSKKLKSNFKKQIP